MSDKNKKASVIKITAVIIVIAILVGILILLIPVEKRNSEIKTYGKAIYELSLTDSRVRYIIDNPNEYPDYFISYIKRTVISSDYDEEEKEDIINWVYNYPFHYNDNKTMSFTDDEINSDKVPALYMSDFRWSYETIGNSYIKDDGCMTVAITMAYLYLTKKTDINPAIIASMAEQIEDMGILSGIGADSSKKICEQIGLNVVEYKYDGDNDKADFQLIKDIIDSGHVVLVGASGEVFGDHAIIIRDYDDNGNVYINDPSEKRNTEKIWAFDDISSEIIYIWDLSC